MLLHFLCGGGYVPRLRCCFGAFCDILVSKVCDNAKRGVVKEYIKLNIDRLEKKLNV